MKKKLKYLLFIMMLVFPIKTFAASISINCPNSVIVGNEIECNITAVNDTLSGIESLINYEGLKYKSSKNLTDSDMFITSPTEFKGVFEITKNQKIIASYTFETIEIGIASVHIDCKKIIDGVNFETMSCDDDTVEINITKENKENESNNDNKENETNTEKDDTNAEEKPNKENNTNKENGTNNKLEQVIKKNNDASLKSIELSSGNIEFNQNVFEYDIVVGNNIENIDIKSITNDPKAKVETIGNLELIPGINKIILKVTAEDDITTKEYVLNINKMDKVLSNNNNIKSLKITNYKLNFDKNTLKYKLSIDKEDTLDIDIELENSLSSYEIIGNSKLKDGSVIKIKVVAEDQSSKIYEIEIQKNNNNIRKIIIICLSIIILATLIIVIKKKN